MLIRCTPCNRPVEMSCIKCYVSFEVNVESDIHEIVKLMPKNQKRAAGAFLTSKTEHLYSTFVPGLFPYRDSILFTKPFSK